MTYLINREAAKRFGPGTGAQLADVFDNAWKSVAPSTNSKNFSEIADTRTLLAKYIIEIAKGGERDPKQLRDRALECLRRAKQLRRPTSGLRFEAAAASAGRLGNESQHP